jgi:MFS-type transporter involved in bile tolerance (Atg22 family)
MEKIGRLAFLAGILLAIILGLVVDSTKVWIAVLAGLGVIVGLLNVTQHEGKTFLIAAIALLLIGNPQSGLVELGASLETVLSNISVFVAPAALVVAGRSLWGTASSK